MSDTESRSKRNARFDSLQRNNLTGIAMVMPDRPCWICGKPADSREHKFKRTDVAQSSKTWAPEDQPYYLDGSGWRRIQGPNSQLVQFARVLCQKCNTTSTQPFDRAYERFAAWVNQKGANLMEATHINFGEIYGDDFQGETLNLLKYFAKHLGCRIASENFTLPQNLALSLTTGDLRPFEVSFSRNSEIKGYPLRGTGVLHNFPTFGRYSPDTGDIHPSYVSGMIVGHLDVIYRYDYVPRYGWEGDSVLPSNRTVRLGEYVQGAPHPTNNFTPGSETSRRIEIGGVEFNIPVLSTDHIQHIISLGSPTSNMTLEQNLETRLTIAHAILAPFYPDVTLDFLKDNMTIPDSDALWNIVRSGG
jgi:hypothetical protein